MTCQALSYFGAEVQVCASSESCLNGQGLPPSWLEKEAPCFQLSSADGGRGAALAPALQLGAAGVGRETHSGFSLAPIQLTVLFRLGLHSNGAAEIHDRDFALVKQSHPVHAVPSS